MSIQVISSPKSQIPNQRSDVIEFDSVASSAEVCKSSPLCSGGLEIYHGS